VVNGLALTCKFSIWHCWEGPETTTGAYGTCYKSAHTVHVINNFNFNISIREVLVVQYALAPSLNCIRDVPMYVRPMEKHELDLVTSTCIMSCNVM
jgi:hypothetical protein